MTMRIKMQLENVVPFAHGGVKAIFGCRYDKQLIDEDLAFMKATPWGTAEFNIDNPAAIKQLVIGQDYYLDFTPAPAKA